MLIITDVTGGGSDATVSRSIVWNPGAPDDPAYVTSWDAVMQAFSGTQGEFRVQLDDSGGGSFAIPAGTYDLQSRMSFWRAAPAEGQLTVSLADGAVIQDLAGIYRNITLELNPTAAPALIVSNGRAIEFDLGSVLENAGSYAGMEVITGETAGLNFYRQSQALATSAEIVGIAAGATLNATFQDGSQASTDWVVGAATSTLVYKADASFNSVTLASPPTTVTTARSDNYSNLADAEGLWWSPVDVYVASGGLALTAGNYTSGVIFRFVRNVTVLGARFYWHGGAAATIRVKLWDPAGTQLKTQDVAVSGAGVYTTTTWTPTSCGVCTGSGYTRGYMFSMWETTGTNYTRIANNMYAIIPSPDATQISRSTYMQTYRGFYAAGDAYPALNIGNTYLIEPVIQEAP